MGTITVNVSDETETFFRRTVYDVLGKGKGKLGSALDEAMKKWASEQEQSEIVERQLNLLKKGFNFGKKLYKQRSDLYER